MRYIVVLLSLLLQFATAQNNTTTSSFELSFFRGNVMPHTPDLYHLQGHPEGLVFNYNLQTHGQEEWHKAYNYPSYGAYLMYQDFNNRFLGHSWAAGGYYDFAFFFPRLTVKTAAGLAYMNQPYDKVTNSKNKAFGSTLLANINIGLQYRHPFFQNRMGLTAGLLFTHYSNGRSKSPNSGINTYGVNLGLTCNLEKPTPINTPDTLRLRTNYREKLHYNMVFRTGFNESSVINSGRHPLYHLGAYIDKRLSRKSGVQLGADLFLTQSFKDFIKYKSAAFPDANIDPNTDYKRAGVFVGYELYINRMSLEAQVGYYFYDPLKNEIPVYDRIGMKYYWTSKVFSALSLKTHMFLAEAIEFGIGLRL